MNEQTNSTFLLLLQLSYEIGITHSRRVGIKEQEEEEEERGIWRGVGEKKSDGVGWGEGKKVAL